MPRVAANRRALCVKCGRNCAGKCQPGLTPEEAREWHDRCKWLIGQYGSLMGIVDALVERTEDVPSKRERDRIEALLLNAFEVWRKR